MKNDHSNNDVCVFVPGVHTLIPRHARRERSQLLLPCHPCFERAILGPKFWSDERHNLVSIEVPLLWVFS